MNPGRKREIHAGLLMALLGAGAVLKGSTYDIGTMADMGPGLFPVVVGCALMLVGGLIAAAAPTAAGAYGGDVSFDLRVWVCILAGGVLFIGLAEFVGLLPAIFASVLVSAWGDRAATWRGSLLLAAGVSAFGIALFTYVLHVQIPVIEGF